MALEDLKKENYYPPRLNTRSLNFCEIDNPL